jgi:predicted RNase H-like HicB family nuclease
MACPIGLVGAVVGQGEIYEEALANVESAITCYLDFYGTMVLAISV